MDMQELEMIRKHSAMVIQKICRKYGVYGNVVYYAPSTMPDSDRNRLYIVAGLDPAIEKDPPPAWLKPDEIVRRNERNVKLFYPDVWAFDLFENRNDIQAQQEMVEYCKRAEFLKGLYAEYDAKLPDKLRVSEISQLYDYRSPLDNPETNDGVRSKCLKDLNWFFRREKSKNSFRHRWLSYFRSERFPDNKNPFAKLRGYFRRGKNTISVKRLMEVNGDLHKLQMQEYEYKLFAQYMKEHHPDVSFSPGDLSVVNHGIYNTVDGSVTPYGRTVTAEEYAVVRKERFATEGYDALADLRPAYWEFRDVYYKAVDEPLVASAYNTITLAYAKCNPLMELKERGDLRLERIPVDDFMNFVSLAKTNQLRFYIDNKGDYATPSLEFVNVIYNGHQEEKLRGITGRMINDKVEFSHLLDAEHPSLNAVIHTIESKPHEIKSQRSSGSRESR